MIVYMYRGNGYLTLKQAEEKRAENCSGDITPIFIPAREVIRQLRKRNKVFDGYYSKGNQK